MSLSLNKPKLDNLAGDIWKSAERLRGKFKAYEYQGVILPIIVIRRLECVLLAWRETKRAEVLAKRPKLTEKELAKLVKELELNPKQSPFSNKTDWTLRKVYEEDHALLEENFRRMLSNPPFGVTWGGKDGYETEARKLEKTRYQAGMPRVNDGAMLFLQTMLAKMIPAEDGGSRISIIFNGSPLSNGDCGSGESEIRRWILENDWLDAIVMLPDQLFYNTGIFTYIWLLRNEKPASHRGRVMLIDARRQFEKEPKAFSYKRNRMTDAHRQWIKQRYFEGWSKGFTDEHVKIFRNQDFAYHKVSVVFWQTDEHDQPAIVTEPYEKAFTAANVKKEQDFHESDLSFRVRVRVKGKEKTVELTVKAKDNAAKKFKEALADADETLAVEWTHRHYVQDDEYIPHGEDIAAFLKREIAKPIIRWQDSPQLGYEILPNKYFYRYQPPTPAKELLAEFWKLEKEAEKMLEGLAQ